MTFGQIKELFKSYAESHPDIRHSEENKGFVACHTDSSGDELVKTCVSEIILVLITPDKRMLPVKGENYNWDKNICFFLLKRCGRKVEDIIVDAQDATEIVADEFFAKLLEDRYSKIRSFNPKSFVMQPVGPMFTDMYGQACMFNLIDEADSATIPGRWL